MARCLTASLPTQTTPAHYRRKLDHAEPANLGSTSTPAPAPALHSFTEAAKETPIDLKPWNCVWKGVVPRLGRKTQNSIFLRLNYIRVSAVHSNSSAGYCAPVREDSLAKNNLNKILIAVIDNHSFTSRWKAFGSIHYFHFCEKHIPSLLFITYQLDFKLSASYCLIAVLWFIQIILVFLSPQFSMSSLCVGQVRPCARCQPL